MVLETTHSLAEWCPRIFTVHTSTDHLGWGVKWRSGSVTTLLPLVQFISLLGFSYNLVVNEHYFFMTEPRKPWRA
jgi:hypothetical protein